MRRRQETNGRTLADLAPGSSGTVCGYADPDDPLAQRLMQLGLLRGTTVKVLRRAPAGDPIEVHLLDYRLSLRAREAGRILIGSET